MKYYLSEIIPRLRKYSASLDQTALLVDKPWVVSNSSDSYDKLIFRNDGRVHLSRDGEVTDGKWEYLPEARSLLIDYGDRKRLYRHQYLDESVFALKIDGKVDSDENYFLLADESNVPDNDAKKYLENKYLGKESLIIHKSDSRKKIEEKNDLQYLRENDFEKIDGKRESNGVYLSRNGKVKCIVKNNKIEKKLFKKEYDNDIHIWQAYEVPSKGDIVEGGLDGNVRLNTPYGAYDITIHGGKIIKSKEAIADNVMLVVFIFVVIFAIAFTIILI